ncbi:MAG: hypothetical protein AB1896_16620 [Thermodesulfobacteriota bacterium]
MSTDYSGKAGGKRLTWESIEDKDWEDYNPKFVLKQVGEYIEKLKSDIKRIKQKAQDELTEVWTERNQLSEKVTDAEDRIQELTKDKTSLQERLEDNEAKLEDARKKIVEMEKEIRKLNRLVSESHDKNELFQQRLDEAHKALDEEKRKLADRVAKEAHHEVTVLLNRIATTLVTDYRNTEKLESGPITVEVGENLRAQLRALFAKLGTLGVDFRKAGK